MAEGFTIEKFAPHTGTRFLMHSGGPEPIELHLESVTDLGSSAQHTQFSMVFQGPPNGPVGQKIYRLDHPVLGQFDLFLVAIGKDQKGVQYEAIVNRGIGD